jgi:quercetin dioxygenase-like cupin family protein
LKGVLIVNLKLNHCQSALIAAVCFSSLVQAEPLLKTTTSWDGGQFHYPKGQAEVSSVILNIAEGVTTKFHCHPVPTLGYILKGDVEVETKDGKKVVLKQGESAVEVMRTVHRGRALAGPVEILVFYAGDTNTPNTVLPENDPEHHYCNN